jgi:hypothetical protein
MSQFPIGDEQLQPADVDGPIDLAPGAVSLALGGSSAHPGAAGGKGVGLSDARGRSVQIVVADLSDELADRYFCRAAFLAWRVYALQAAPGFIQCGVEGP